MIFKKKSMIPVPAHKKNSMILHNVLEMKKTMTTFIHIHIAITIRILQQIRNREFNKLIKVKFSTVMHI